ncbi:MAG: hypothetical protein AAF790_00780 [Planctomycetota bacterium]
MTTQPEGTEARSAQASGERDASDLFLGACRQALGPAPRGTGFFRRTSIPRATKPDWCEPSDPLSAFFKHQDSLLKRGVVVWGCVVQANGLLWEPGPHDCPGEMVYSVALDTPCDLKELGRVASRLYALKGTEPAEPAAARIARHLTNQFTREFGAPVPESCSPAMRCGLSTTFFSRAHLPGQMLQRPIVPLLLHHKSPYVAMPLPAKYWPDAMVDWWVSSR